MSTVKLDDKPARKDLTDRECSKIIGGVLGALNLMVTDSDTLRRAVKWWAESDEVWQAMHTQRLNIESIVWDLTHEKK